MANEIDIIVRAKDATAGAWKSVSARAKKLGASLKRGMAGAAKFAKNAAAAVALVGAAAAAGAIKAIGAYKAQAEAEAKLEAVLKATGWAAGKTSGELKKQASALQELTGVGDEVIISTMGIIATFKNIKGDEFDRTTMAVLDMSAVMKKAGADTAAVEAASISVGKALNDPIKGMAQLNRVGVTFTDQQKEQVRTMQAAGDMAGAQAVILRELEGEFGGTAEAMSKANHGVDQLKASFGDTIEVIGKAIVESDGFDGIIAKMTQGLQSLSESGYIELWAQNVRKAIEFIAPAFSKVGAFFGGIKEKIQEAAGFVGALSAGSSISEAAEISKRMPAELAKDKQERLKAIREERAAKAEAKEEAEKQEMNAAAAKRELVNQTKRQVTAEKEVERALKASNVALEKAKNAEQKRLAAVEKLAGLKQQQAQQQGQAVVAGFQAAAAKNQEKINAAQKKVAGLAMNREQRREKQLADRQDKRDADRVKELKDRVDRGVVLGKDNAAFLAKAEQLAIIAKQEGLKDENLGNAQERIDKAAQDARDRIVIAIEKEVALLEKNILAGA